MSTQALAANGYVNEVRTNTGRWPDYQDVCRAVECSIEIATRAIATVQHWWGII